MFNGKPIIVVSPNGVEYEALKQLNMDFNDLTEALREVNVFSFDEVQYAIIETNGKLTVLPNAQNAPLTATDFKIKKEESTLPIMVICDGKKIQNNMNKAKIDDDFLYNQIKKAGVFRIKDVLIATIDNCGKMYIQAKHKKYIAFNSNYKGGGNW